MLAPGVTLLGVERDPEDKPTFVEVSKGVALRVPFKAEFEDDDVTITLTIDVRHGRPICSRYDVRATKDGDDLLLRTTDVARGYNIRWLAATACAREVVEQVTMEEGRRCGGLQIDTGTAIYSTQASLEAIEAVIGPIRRRREPVTDERLRELAEAFKRDYRPGRGEEFAASQNLSERQMRRLVKMARERGFLPPKEAAK